MRASLPAAFACSGRRMRFFERASLESLPARFATDRWGLDRSRLPIAVGKAPRASVSSSTQRPGCRLRENVWVWFGHCQAQRCASRSEIESNWIESKSVGSIDRSSSSNQRSDAGSINARTHTRSPAAQHSFVVCPAPGTTRRSTRSIGRSTPYASH